ncbi:hypothetical protein [Halomonas salinarum]|nr:hypothetical protein [Halomonas salinarum]
MPRDVIDKRHTDRADDLATRQLKISYGMRCASGPNVSVNARRDAQVERL